MNENSLTVLREEADVFIKSGFLPSHIDTPEKAITIILKGRELGIKPLYALSHISIIEGKPTMSAELMLSQIFRLHPATQLRYTEQSEQCCTLEISRGSEFHRFSFSMADAITAGVTHSRKTGLIKDAWKRYPRAMLRARCISEMARAMYPDALSGVSYTPEELDDVRPAQEYKDSAVKALGNGKQRGDFRKATDAISACDSTEGIEAISRGLDSRTWGEGEVDLLKNIISARVEVLGVGREARGAVSVR